MTIIIREQEAVNLEGVRWVHWRRNGEMVEWKGLNILLTYKNLKIE